MRPDQTDFNNYDDYDNYDHNDYDADHDDYDEYNDQIFSKPIPIIFSIQKNLQKMTRYFFYTNFFRNQYFFHTKIFQNRYQYFFRYQNFSKPIPILFSIPNFFETDTDTIKTIGKVSKPRSFETEMSHSVRQEVFVRHKKSIRPSRLKFLCVFELRGLITHWRFVRCV